MKVFLTKYYQDKPLVLLLWIAFLVRVIAVIFSKGYYAHDDHFLVVGVAQDWVNGLDRDGWFVHSFEANESGRNLLYPGLHYLLFEFLEAIGINSPDSKMFFVRLLHAIYSLLVVSLSYKIGLLLTTKKRAFIIGLLLALIWFIPFISVRNLIEWVSVPPLLYVAYLLMKESKSISLPFYMCVLGGVLLGVSFSIRYQTILVSLGYGIGVLYFKRWKTVGGLLIGFLVYFVFVHGYVEYLMCNQYFGKLISYVTYNIENAHTYFSEPWFIHLIYLNVFVLPPIGFLFTFGVFKVKKDRLILFLGFLLFFVYHSYFPNKQERFIFTIVPHFVILGLIGFSEFYDQSKFWKTRPNLLKGFVIFFILLNTYMLAFMTTFYSKKARCEVMKYVRETNEAVDLIIVENSTRGGTNYSPDFYAGRTIDKIEYVENTSSEQLQLKIATSKRTPDFVLFEVKPNETLSVNRVETMRKHFPTLIFSKRVNGSFMDHFRHKLNKVVKNYDFVVYEIKQN